MVNRKQYIKHLLFNSGDLKENEKVLLLYDSMTKELAEAIGNEVKYVTDYIEKIKMPDAVNAGLEPKDDVKTLMLNSDLILCLTTKSLAHTKARQLSSLNGTRYLSLPDYDEEVLYGDALLCDYRSLTDMSSLIADLFTKGQTIRIESDLGTQMTCDISNRTGNAAPGWCYANGTIASPPDAETNVAPIEASSNGRLVIDGSIGGYGCLNQPIELIINNGVIEKFVGYNAEQLNDIFSRVEKGNPRVLCEIGIGLNPRAKLTGRMLEDEGSAGTIHFGFGSNATIGGQNTVAFHLDFMMKHANLWIDENKIIENGKIILQ